MIKGRMQDISQMLIFSGAVLVILGIIYSGKLGPLGKLPGDIVVNRSNFTFFFPLTTIILINLLVLLVIWLSRK